MNEQPHTILSAKDLGKLVRTSRKRAKLNQTQFADVAGVGRRFLSECEAGKNALEFGKLMLVLQASGIDLVAVPRWQS